MRRSLPGGSARSGTRRAAFTLVELLVVIAIIGVLVGVLLPALQSARDTAMVAESASNLRQLAMGGTSHASDHGGAYCTGPWDNRYNRGYGPIDTHGWVADFVNGAYCVPGELLDPGSPALATETLGSDLGDPGAGDDRKLFTQEDIESLVRRGMNTNYCQSWYMGMSEMRDPRLPPNRPKDVNDTEGPLRMDFIRATSHQYVPLFGTGKIRPADRTTSMELFGDVVSTAESMTDGPLLARTSGSGWVSGRQDYTDFGPTLGSGSHKGGKVGHNRTIGLLAMADGHVERVKDANGDNQFGARANHTRQGWRTHEYHELEGVAFGGVLSGRGIGF
jgi:prepilin-type N-terminal cleavage/methylation domain-containing protein